MKICNNCNSTQPDSVKVCTNCGSSSLRNSIEKISYYEDYNFAEIKKSRNKKMIYALIIGVLAITVIIALTIIKISLDNSFDKKQYAESTTCSIDGEIVQNIYTNKWADLKIQLVNNWQNAPDKKYKSYEDKITKCDLYAMNDNNASIVVLITDLSFEEVGNYSEYELINEMSSGIGTRIANAKTEENSYQLIGNQLYLHTNITGMVEKNNISVSLYTRIIDDKAIIINVTSDSIEENQHIVEKIESCV